MHGKLKIGTCSWNYESWVGLVYSQKCARSACYLKEYSQQYRTVEIDSWFYRVPDPRDVTEYLAQVDPEFTFSGKVTQNILLTHLRSRNKADKALIPNPDFLSPEVFGRFIDSIREMLPRIDALELEFEYLKRDKMPSLGVFLNRLAEFYDRIEPDLPLAIETRNKNFLQREYFEFLQERHITHVFSEKLYMPHIYEVNQRFGDLLGNRVVIRLLGGDRAAIEEATGNRWDRIVDPKKDLVSVAAMIDDLLNRGTDVFLYVNNHYEGSAPLTIEKLLELL